jgi:hypothetical protein
MPQWEYVVRAFAETAGDFQSFLNQQAHERWDPVRALPAEWLGGLSPSMEDLVSQAPTGLFVVFRRPATGTSPLERNR